MTRKETYISRQARRLSKGQIDRRRFVMSALATGVTMPTAMSLASRAEAARPKAGGHLRFGVSSGAALKRHLARAVGTEPVSGETGPYQIVERLDNGTVHLARNQAFNTADQGHFDTIEIRPMPDARLRQSAVMTGEVDVIDAVDPRALAMLSSLPEVGIAETEGESHIAADVMLPDPHLIAALRAAIDRAALLERGYLGHGAIGDDRPYRSETPAIAHDPDRVRWHLRAAGVGQVTLAVDVSGLDAGTDLLALINAATENVGIALRPAQTGQQVDMALQQMDTALSPGTSDEGKVAQHALPPSVTNRLIPVWTNDLVAHSGRLARAPSSGSADILTNWWFL